MPHPMCTGDGDAQGRHCCYLGRDDVTGEQAVCEWLRVDDPRTDRHFACGLFLDFKDQFPNKSDEWLWGKVTSHPQYETKVQAFLESKGIDPCPLWRGDWMADGHCHGRCCYRGWVWDDQGGVIEQP